MGKIKDRKGEVGYNNNGEEMRIVRYGGVHDIDIQFVKDGTIVEHRRYDNFKTGQISNPMTPSLFGIGFMGIGEFESRDENGKETKCHVTWSNMHQRCYDPKCQEKRPTYENCTVCEEWNNYQAFAKWHNENYYEVGNERMMLDKDILHKGNKIYSPDTCIYVPQFINSLFTKSNNKRGKYPIGVCKKGNRFVAQLNKGNGKQIHLGYYTTPEEAFQAYKIAKEQYIKEVAEEYKDKIPYKLYEAMINYKVDIND